MKIHSEALQEAITAYVLESGYSNKNKCLAAAMEAFEGWYARHEDRVKREETEALLKARAEEVLAQIRQTQNDEFIALCKEPVLKAEEVQAEIAGTAGGSFNPNAVDAQPKAANLNVETWIAANVKPGSGENCCPHHYYGGKADESCGSND